MAFSDEQIRLILNLGDSKRNVDEVRAALDAMGESAESAARAGAKVEEGTEKAARGTRNLGRSMLETGRIVQDFAQGGIGGILNNVEGFAAAVGLGSGVAGAITAVGVAAYVAYPPLRDFVKGLVDGKNDIPKMAESFATLAEDLKTVGERLKEIKEKGFFTTAELGEYNELLDKQAGIEKRIADEKERQAAFDKAKKAAAGAGNNAEAAEIAETIINDMMGGADAARSQVGRDLVGRSQAGGMLGRIRAQQDADERARQAAEDAGQDTIQVDGADGQKHFVDREKYFAARAKATMDAYRAELSKLGQEADKVVSEALAGNNDAAVQMATRFDPTRAREWLQATQVGRDRADAEMADSEAFADRARGGVRQRAARRAASAEQQKTEAGALKAVMEQRRLDEQRAEAETQAEFDAFNQGREANLGRAAGTREQQEVMNKAREAVQLQRDAADRQRLRGIAFNETGIDLSDDQAADALTRADALIKDGMAPAAAGRKALGELILQLMQTAQEANQTVGMTVGEIVALRAQVNALQGMQRQTRTRMGRGR